MVVRFSNERTMGPDRGCVGKAHGETFGPRPGGFEFPGIPTARAARACACARVRSPIVSFCQSETTLRYYSASVFLLPFFVSVPETVQRIQGPLTTRVIIGPSPTAASSELRVSAARPLPYVPLPKSTARSFLLQFFIIIISLLRTRTCAHNIPIIHGCGTTETETHLRLRVLIHQFLANYNTI